MSVPSKLTANKTFHDKKRKKSRINSEQRYWSDEMIEMRSWRGRRGNVLGDDNVVRMGDPVGIFAGPGGGIASTGRVVAVAGVGIVRRPERSVLLWPALVVM